VVECDLAKVEVAGSNPVSRSSLSSFSEARYPSGKGEVCKTFMRGFDSHPRLQSIRLSLQSVHARDIGVCRPA
jgi:hypothetical protein